MVCDECDGVDSNLTLTLLVILLKSGSREFCGESKAPLSPVLVVEKKGEKEKKGKKK